VQVSGAPQQPAAATHARLLCASSTAWLRQAQRGSLPAQRWLRACAPPLQVLACRQRGGRQQLQGQRPAAAAKPALAAAGARAASAAPFPAAGACAPAAAPLPAASAGTRTASVRCARALLPACLPAAGPVSAAPSCAERPPSADCQQHDTHAVRVCRRPLQLQTAASGHPPWHDSRGLSVQVRLQGSRQHSWW
jgi:hypothetical protein